MGKIGGSKGYLEKRFNYLLYFYTNEDILDKAVYKEWWAQFDPLKEVPGFGNGIRLYRYEEQRKGQFPKFKYLSVYGFDGEPAKMKKAVSKLKIREGSCVIFYKAIAPLVEKDCPQDAEEHIFMALTNARDGKEKEFNKWYNEHHAPEIVRIRAYRSCRRFKVVSSAGEGVPYDYLAFYRFGGTHDQMIEDLKDYAFAGGNVLMEKLYKPMDSAWVYSEITKENEKDVEKQMKAKPSRGMEFYAALKKRRSVYVTSSECPIPDEELVEILKKVADNMPSSFNSQGTRVVLLLGEENADFWNIVLETLRKVAPKEGFKATEDKINMLATSHGTILYYEDMDVVKGLQKAFPIYKDSFPVWAEHSNAMMQYAIWTALTIEKMGATLQHYNPIIDKAVAERFNIPASWKLIGQMPFGGIFMKPDKARHLPIEEKVYVFK